MRLSTVIAARSVAISLTEPSAAVNRSRPRMSRSTWVESASARMESIVVVRRTEAGRRGAVAVSGSCGPTSSGATCCMRID